MEDELRYLHVSREIFAAYPDRVIRRMLSEKMIEMRHANRKRALTPPDS